MLLHTSGLVEKEGGKSSNARQGEGYVTPDRLRPTNCLRERTEGEKYQMSTDAIDK